MLPAIPVCTLVKHSHVCRETELVTKKETFVAYRNYIRPREKLHPEQCCSESPPFGPAAVLPTPCRDLSGMEMHSSDFTFALHLSLSSFTAIPQNNHRQPCHMLGRFATLPVS